MGSQHQDQHKQPKQHQGDQKGPPSVQGEGDYEAVRRFRKDYEEFLATHDSDELAREAEPQSEEEAFEMTEAEARGRSRSHASPQDNQLDDERMSGGTKARRRTQP